MEVRMTTIIITKKKKKNNNENIKKINDIEININNNVLIVHGELLEKHV